MPEALVETLPTLAIYADGRVFTATRSQLANRFALEIRRIAPADVGRLVDLALDARVGEPAPKFFGEFDAPDTLFRVVTNDGVKETRAYTLDVGGRGVDAQGIERQMQLRSLHDKLMDLPGTLGPSAVTPARTYMPDSVAAIMTRFVPHPWDPSPQTGGLPVLEWPGPAPGYDVDRYLAVCATLTGSLAHEVYRAVLTDTFARFWTKAGTHWQIRVRPLLPNELGCASIAPSHQLLDIR